MRALRLDQDRRRTTPARHSRSTNLVHATLDPEEPLKSAVWRMVWRSLLLRLTYAAATLPSLPTVAYGSQPKIRSHFVNHASATGSAAKHDHPNRPISRSVFRGRREQPPMRPIP